MQWFEYFYNPLTLLCEQEELRKELIDCPFFIYVINVKVNTEINTPKEVGESSIGGASCSISIIKYT